MEKQQKHQEVTKQRQHQEVREEKEEPRKSQRLVLEGGYLRVVRDTFFFALFIFFSFLMVGKAKDLFLLHVSDCEVQRVVKVEDTQDTRLFFWFLAGVEG